MNVLVSVMPAFLWQHITTRFDLTIANNITELSRANSQSVLLSKPMTTDEMGILLSKHPQLELVVAYESAECTVARMLKDGVSLIFALEQWQSETQSLLNVQQQHRRQLKIFNASWLQDNFTALPAWLRDVSRTSLSEQQIVVDPVLTLIANQAIRQNLQAYALNQRLVASSLPVSEHSEPLFNLTQIQQQFCQKDELEKLTIEQLKSAELKERELLQKLQVAREELDVLTAKHQQQTDILQQTSDERQQLLEQLLQVQEALEQEFIKHESFVQELQQLKSEHSVLQQQLEHEHTELLQQLKSEHSVQLQQLQHEHNELLQQKIPALNAAIEQAKLQNSALENENKILLEQLLQVQEELERCLLASQSEEQKANHAALAKDRQHQREQTKLESQLRRMKARAASAEHNVSLLQQELAALRGSRLWKSTAPVRVFGRMLNKKDENKQRLQQEVALILTSEYFDLDWYVETYPDVAHAKINPAEHYLRFGAIEGRMPGPLFDGNWYLQRYPDVADAQINPLLHFIKYGQQEGRSASPKLLTDNSQQREE